MKSIAIKTLAACISTATCYTRTGREMDLAIKCAEYLKAKGCKAEIDEHGEDENEDDGHLYKTVQRRLLIDGECAMEWSIASVGFFSDGHGNPNHSSGWNVDDATEGGDYLHDEQKAITDIFGLTDEAEELPDIDEPTGAEESSEEEAEYALMIRNTYTAGMEDFAPRAYYATREEAEKGMEESIRAFKSANSANSYGPEWAIGTKDEDGSWIAEEVSEEV